MTCPLFPYLCERMRSQRPCRPNGAANGGHPPVMRHNTQRCPARLFTGSADLSQGNFASKREKKREKETQKEIHKHQKHI